MAAKQTRKPDHKILVRLPVDQHDELREAAKLRRISVNSAVLFAIEDWLVTDELSRRRNRKRVEDQPA